MKKLFFLLLIMLLRWQRHRGIKAKSTSVPDEKRESMLSRHSPCERHEPGQIFEVINQWAKKSYAKDIFLSNVNSKKSKGTINVSSKVEMLLNDTDKTIIKYKMKINCHDNCYSAEVSNIVYQYDPQNNKKFKTYSAESVIANNGKSNTVA